MAMGTDAVAKTDMKKDYFPVGALAPLQLVPRSCLIQDLLQQAAQASPSYGYAHQRSQT